MFSESGHPALAAMELEAAGAGAAARLEWERVLRDPRLGGKPYETALAHFNLGGALTRLGDRAGGARELATASRMLEAAADDLETAGEALRAFDCYVVIVRLGKDLGSFETVAEGYLNMIRLIIADDNVRAVQYYDDFMHYAVEQKEWYAAATLAREVAEHCLRVGLVWDRHYQMRAAELWMETARANQAAGGPVDLSANALQAAIDAASALGDFALAGRVYADLAELPLPDVRRQRYRSLARRYESEPTPNIPSPPFPEVMRRQDSYQDVWRQDLVEWELDGDPIPVLVRLLAEDDRLAYVRTALQAILKCADAGFVLTTRRSPPTWRSRSGGVQQYVVLRPLERLFEHARPEGSHRRAARAGDGLEHARAGRRAQGARRSGARRRGPGAGGAARRGLHRRPVAADAHLPRVERRARAAGGAGGRRHHRQEAARRRRRWSCSTPRDRRRARSRRRPWPACRRCAATTWRRCCARRATPRSANAATCSTRS